MQLSFKPINKEYISDIIPLLTELNTTTPEEILKKRVHEMFSYDTYECVGAFDGNKLIGVSGLWYSTRHYIGKSVEPDHVIIDKTYRGKNIGAKFFEWIYQYTKSKGCEATELNSYTGNKRSHKFYYNEGYEIYGFHFVKVMRDDKKFY